MVFGNDAAKALDEFSSKLQQASVYGDESINVVMGQIGAFGATEEQTKALTQATVDLSAGLGIDLNTAGLLVAKTFGTSTDALTRYGVGAMGATEQSEKFENIINNMTNTYINEYSPEKLCMHWYNIFSSLSGVNKDAI